MSPTTPNLRDISPELVLVDPELRSAVRVPSGGPLEVSEPALPAVPDGPAAAASEESAPADARRVARPARRLARVMLVSVGAASLAANAVVVADAFRSSRAPVGELPAAPAAAVVDSVRASGRTPKRAAAREAAPRDAALTPPLRTATTSRQTRPPPASNDSTPAKRRNPARVERPRDTPTPGKAAAAVPVKSTATHRRTTTRRPSASRPRSASRSKVPAPTRVGQNTQKTAAEHAVLSWKPVDGASYYNLVLWHGRRRLLDLWPASSRALLPRTWTRSGSRGSLRPGRYLWFAYPGFGSRAAANYGKAVQSGLLIVTDTKGN